MTKSRKKNYKLIRRVKRTIASIIMIMAVVVAAIPVENYGTMQASGIADGEDMREKANSYLFDTNNTLRTGLKKYTGTENKDNAYTGDTKTVQHIEGDTFIDAYQVKLSSSGKEAMIYRSVFKNDIEQFDIF